MTEELITQGRGLPAQPISRRKTYELVAEKLVEMIGEGALRPGDPLPTERELTDGFQVGRSSVREALRMLESQGVIRGANAGAFVVAEAMNPLNSSLRLLFALDERAGIHDLFELRRILECEAAALAAERRTDEHLQEMDAAIEEMAGGLGDVHGDRFIDADLRFHLALASATGNRVVLHSMHAVRDVLRRALMTVYTIPRSPESAVVEHRAIREAVAARDAERARREMATHIARVETDVDRGSRHG
ncbi:MAG TPA: FadR/GntR family transcriptional regulator [Gaiellaceae bacterium]|nr:FadR/GntR family transcriptional regulator [Gaiellaceae bacterium]